jgi:UDP-glucose 4-epimerase
MKLLVTGGAGYIGSVVSEAALAAGHTVTAIDTLAEGHATAVPPGARFVHADAGDPRVLDAVLARAGFDAVVHLAAETTIALSMTDPARYFSNNVGTTLALLEGMRRHGVRRMVFSSTAAVYGEPETAPIDERHPLRPINAYGESKLMCERMLEWFCRAYGFAAVAFRYFNAAGASATRGEAHRHESHLIPVALQAAIAGTPVPVHGLDYATRDGSCVRDFVHVLDIAEGHLAALPALDQLGFDVFNLGTGHGQSVLEVVQEIGRITGRDLRIEASARRPGDPATLVADGARARQRIGWTPRRSSLGCVIESAWRWMGAHPTGYAD